MLDKIRELHTKIGELAALASRVYDQSCNQEPADFNQEMNSQLHSIQWDLYKMEEHLRDQIEETYGEVVKYLGRY